MDEFFNKNKGYVDSKAYQLNKKIDNYKADTFAEVAEAMAMSSIPKKEGFTTSYGIAVSNYRNQQAIAAGIEPLLNLTFQVTRKGVSVPVWLLVISL